MTKTWFADVVAGDHRCKLVLLDQKNVQGGEREFTVETDANAYAGYYDNAFAWLLTKQDWKFDDTVLAPSNRVATTDAKA